VQVAGKSFASHPPTPTGLKHEILKGSERYSKGGTTALSENLINFGGKP